MSGIGERYLSKQKLELTWIGKDRRPNLEPRILIEDSAVSYHSATASQNGRFENCLIAGDNLLALKALLHDFAGQVKCVFIDPPYNTGSAFEHYDDGLEHSVWLNLMRERLVLLRELLAEEGSIWISIDNNEAHYLKVVCDEVFGRPNFRASITWQRKYSVSNNASGIASICDYILVYARSESFKNNLLPRTEESAARYTNPDGDPRGPWKAVDYLNQATPEQRPNLCYDIINPTTGDVVRNTKKAWKYDRQTHASHVSDRRLWWGLDGRNSVPALKLFLSEVRAGMTPHDLWLHEEVGHTDEAKKESIALYGPRKVFATPKPERLLKRVLDLATQPGDLVLDSFAGSGTTGAVAQKMGRRWIMIEMGEHMHTHVIPRMKKVIDGEDLGGVTEAVGWNGGGGFRYCRLAPSLITMDGWGNPVINRAYNGPMLAEALCKLEGFTYAPSDTVYWQQGRSTERDFLYVTTTNLGPDQLRQLSDEVGPDRTLLVLCTAFRGEPDAYPNLTVRKIPTHVLGRCEWGKDDYSLAIASLPPAPPPEGQQEMFVAEKA